MVLVAALVQGCAVWTRIDQPEQDVPGTRHRVEAPVGWVRLTAARDVMLLTRDGPNIQWIRVTQVSAEKFFATTKATVPAGALPNEIAHLVLAELKAAPEGPSLQLKSMTPSRLGDEDAVRLHVVYRNADGARYDRVMIAARRADELLFADYRALSRHFFERDLPVFDKLVQSMR